MVIGGVHFRIFALTNLNSSSYQNAQTVYSDCDLLGSLVRNGCEESPGEIYFKPVTKTNANFITAISNITKKTSFFSRREASATDFFVRPSVLTVISSLVACCSLGHLFTATIHYHTTDVTMHIVDMCICLPKVN